MFPPVTTHPDALALLAVARRTPADSLPRWVLADWLEEHGEPEVARVMRETLAGRTWQSFPRDASRRWYPIQGCYAGWPGVRRASDTGLPDTPWLCSVVFVRLGGPGLGEVVRPLLWSDQAGRVVAVRAKNCDLRAEQLAGLLTRSALPNLAELDLSYNPIGGAGVRAVESGGVHNSLSAVNLMATDVGDEAAGRLARWPTLTRLDLGFNHLTDAGARALASAGALRELKIDNNAVGPGGMAAVLSSQAAESFDHVWADIYSMGDPVAEAWAASPPRPLGALGVGSGRMVNEGPEGIYALVGRLQGANALPAARVSPPPVPRVAELVAAAGCLDRLAELDLGYCGIGDPGAVALAGARHLHGLRSLAIARCGVGAAGALALLGSDHLGQVSRLVLDGNEVGVDGLRAIVNHPGVARLSHLGLRYVRPGPDGGRHLARSPHASGLRVLGLGFGRLGDEGASALAVSDHLGGLEVLDLKQNDLGDVGVRAVLASPRLSGLRSLDLSRNRFGEGGVRGLAESPWITGLEELRVGDCGSGTAVVEALTALPQAGGLRCLDVSGEHCGIQPVEVQRLLETPHMGQLTTLVLRYDTVPSDGREAFWEEFPVCEFRR